MLLLSRKEIGARHQESGKCFRHRTLVAVDRITRLQFNVLQGGDFYGIFYQINRR